MAGLRASPAGPFALALAALAPGLKGCAAPPRPIPHLASAEVASDFADYEIHRVGVPPVADGTAGWLSAYQAAQLQHALAVEVAQETRWELVPLLPKDLEAVPASEPHLVGRYRPRTLLALAERFDLDALLFGRVLELRFFPPQLLSLEVELVSTETGMVLWSASLHLDAGDPLVVEALRLYYARPGRPDGAHVALLSPERFARFAAFQVARLL